MKKLRSSTNSHCIPNFTSLWHSNPGYTRQKTISVFKLYQLKNKTSNASILAGTCIYNHITAKNLLHSLLPPSSVILKVVVSWTWTYLRFGLYFHVPSFFFTVGSPRSHQNNSLFLPLTKIDGSDSVFPREPAFRMVLHPYREPPLRILFQ